MLDDSLNADTRKAVTGSICLRDDILRELEDELANPRPRSRLREDNILATRRGEQTQGGTQDKEVRPAGLQMDRSKQAGFSDIERSRASVTAASWIMLIAMVVH